MEQLLLTDNGYVKLLLSSDEGVDDSSQQDDMFSYSAPEVCDTMRQKSAVWSLGICIAEMIDGRSPFAGCTSTQVMINNKNNA